MPMLFFSPVLPSSTVSSITRFMKGSNPRRNPVTARPPFSFTVKFNTHLYIIPSDRARLAFNSNFRHTEKTLIRGKNDIEETGLSVFAKWLIRVHTVCFNRNRRARGYQYGQITSFRRFSKSYLQKRGVIHQGRKLRDQARKWVECLYITMHGIYKTKIVQS